MEKEYDLEERTTFFSEKIIVFCGGIKRSTITNPLISQLVRAATSIGANYCEANGASSKKDFKNKIHICKKEAQETKYWLRVISTADPKKKDEARELWREAQELLMIFGKIAHSCKGS
ncbi:MAG: four helix bundle protein [Patescibacteria group bacterium]|nr:four helix bundle protein [Patescibacteria group bacterium]